MGKTTKYCQEKMSKWYRWDLHIHTPGTKMNDKFTDDKGDKPISDAEWEQYCQALNDYGADVLGITDYFAVDNFFNLKENREKWGLNSNIILFPNIEVRLNDLVSKKRAEKGKETSYVNVHFIFKPDIARSDLEKFLREIKMTGPNGRSLNCIDDLDKIITDNRVEHMPTSSDVKAALRSVFGDNYSESVLVMIPNSDDGINLKDGNGSKNGRQFIQDSVDIIQARNAKGSDDQKYLLKDNNSYGKVFPSVTGCDAHQFETIEKFPKNAYTWIRTERTFEGLRQITYEPELRVKIQEHKPEAPVKSKIIKSLKLSNPAFTSSKKGDLEFSDGLNTIIGGRSSGKSVLLSIIGKLAGKEKSFKNNNPHYNELIEKLSENCVLTYADGSTSNGKLKDGLGQIKFIYQDGLQEIARNNDKRNKFIKNTLSKLASVDAIEKKNGDYESQKNADIVNFCNQLKKLDEQIQTKQEWIHSQQDIDTIRENINSLKDGVQSRQIQIKDIDQDSIDSMLKEKRRIDSEIEIARKDLNELQSLFRKDIVQLNPQIQQFTQKIIKEEIIVFKDSIARLNEKLKEKISIRISEKQDFIEERSAEGENLMKSERYEQFEKLQKNSPELRKYQGRLSEQQSILEHVETTKQELGELEVNRNKVLAELKGKMNFEDVLSTEDIYQTEDRALNFQYITSIDVDAFLELIGETFKTSGVVFKTCIEDLSKGFDIDKSDTFNAENIEKMMERCLNLGANLVKDKNPYRAGETLYTWLERFSRFTFIQANYKIIYGKQDFSEMSEGKQAFILLMMQLSLDKDDKPFLIDQPEDELDNKAIYEELVSYLRTQKQQRQLFVVTHNANVLVGGDSECVTLADEKIGNNAVTKRQFSYEQGPIEDPNMQNEICAVLEGGQRAFEKREQRYAFSRN